MKSRFAARPLAAALALALAPAAPALAMQFEFANGIKANLDTTVSYGVSIRAEDRDSSLIGIANGGTSRSVNEDNGDLNFDRGRPFANIVKATSEVELKWRNFGFFGRGMAFYDFDLHDSDKLGPEGRKRLGKDVVGLDGFIYGSFDPAGHTTRVRAGRQVISWGESTFIANGINVINAVDVSKLRIPGSELKEAFLPATGVWGSVELTKAANVEGFYLTNHDRIRIDPKGSYFSNNDFASDDATMVFVGLGRRRDEHAPFPTNPVPPGVPTISATSVALFGPYDPAAAVWAPRSRDRDPSDNGQYGVALRYLADNLNNTEFGLYFMNYHSRIPLFSGIRGAPTSVITGSPLQAPICGVPALSQLCHTGTGTYFAEYPEDIKLYGISFNTQGPFGVALQGEYSYRPNLPVQYATVELLLAALGAPNLITGFTQIPGLPVGATTAALVPVGTYIQGYRRLKASQLQVTATKSVPNIAHAEQLIMVGEAGMNYFHAFPTDVKFNGPGLFLPATALGAAASGAFSVQPGGFATRMSWGYRLAARLEYANALAGGNLAPRAAFNHDVKGVGPNFNEDAKSYSLGLSWDYQRRWLVDLQYTSYFGGRFFSGTDTAPPPAGSGQSQSWRSSAYPLLDRDFFSFTVSYSF
jgi:hypothetical protein